MRKLLLLGAVLLTTVVVEPVTEYNPKVTIVHSINNVVDTPYKPKLEDINIDLGNKISEDYEIGSVFTGYFNNDHKEPIKGTSPSRALEILGYDFQIYDESVTSNYSYTNKKMSDSQITRSMAIMNLYKAYGKEKYSFRIFTYPDYSIDIEKTPFAEKITIPVESLDLSKAKTEVFVSRSKKSLYWQTALDDYLVVKGTENQIMTLGEFCVLAKNFMVRFGEPVLTQLEENYLMQVYGKELPYSLTTNELEAVKYLVARGIVDTNKNFREPLQLNDMLEMLMRVKDKDSRETFKNIVITYDEELLEAGYYPIDVAISEEMPIQITKAVDTYNSDMYDYLVRKINGISSFTDAKGDPYILSTTGEYQKNQIFVGEVSINKVSYWHFKLPEINSGQRVFIAFPGIENTVELELGGGWYYQSKYSKEDNIFKRSRFKDSKYQDYVPSNGTILGRIFGEPIIAYASEDTLENIVSFKISTDDGSVYYDGVKIKDNPKCVIAKNVVTVKDNLTPTEIISKITVSGSSKVSSKRTAFSKLGGDEWLVNVQYLMDVGLVYNFDIMDKGVYRMTTHYGTVYVNTNRGYIVVGQTVYKINNEDTIYFYHDAATGDYYVSYKAIIGWSSKIYVYDNNGVASLVSTTSVTDLQTRRVMNACTSISNQYTNTEELLALEVGNDIYISLNCTYNLANYFVYTEDVGDENGNALNYLFVFKLRSRFEEGSIDETLALDLLNTRVGISVPKEWVVFAYNLSTKDYPEITYDSNYGYLYKIPEYKYKDDALIPIYYASADKMKIRSQLRGAIIDYNMNTFTVNGKDLPYGKVPALLAKKEHSSTNTKGSADAVTGEGASKGSGKSDVISIKEYAPVGIISSMVGTKDVSLKEIQNKRIYLGTLYVPKVTKENNEVILAIDDLKFKTGVKDTDKVFKLSSIDYVDNVSYGYVVYNAVSLTAINSVIESNPLNVENTGEDIGFHIDWEEYKFNRLINKTDDLLTIVLILVLNFLPRVAMGALILLMVLSTPLFRDFKPWISFCDKLFDPYKMLTLRRKNVHTVSTIGVMVGAVIGVGLFGLVMDGHILHLIAYIGRGVTGIMSR